MTRRWIRARSLIPSWFRDDPLTAPLAYILGIGVATLGALVIYVMASRP